MMVSLKVSRAGLNLHVAPHRALHVVHWLRGKLGQSSGEHHAEHAEAGLGAAWLEQSRGRAHMP